MEINKMIGSCGLCCVLCNDKLKGSCEGCMDTKAESCDTKACCQSIGVAGCFDCSKFPCDKEMFNNKRVSAFNKFAKENGAEKLAACLIRNDEAGIKYHKPDGSKGDYDKLETEAEIIKLIEQGR
ncbi:MAG: DUF3795 domain-containing protein [Bacillota bacterium]